MNEFLDEVTDYFGRVSDEFIIACKEIQQIEPPEWAKSGSFWLQHDDGFDGQLPLALGWHDGESGYDNAVEDPIRKIVTVPWDYGDSDHWPSEVVHPAWEVEDAMRLRICNWVRECWIRSGGRSHPVRFYVTDFAGAGSYCLRRGRFVSPGELDNDLAD